MDLRKLTTQEIEQRINQYRERTAVLNDIIKDIKDPKAKTTLKTHLENYQEIEGQLRNELAQRNNIPKG